MKTILQENAAAETYGDVERMLDKLCWDHVRRWGGDFDEWRSVANMAFVRAFAAHVPARGQFITLVHCCVRNALRNETRARTRREAALSTNEDMDRFEESTHRGVHWMDEMTTDAQLVARMVLDTPRELVEATLGHRVDDILGGLRFALSQAGWGQGRATDAFNEIREALPCRST